jgi:hypothetical protein
MAGVSVSEPEEDSMESAKRRGPAAVAPVTSAGVRYEALRGARSRGFEQDGGVIAAFDAKTGKELWTLQVYQTRYDPSEETDVQEVYIVRMTLSPSGDALIVENERRKRFSVSLRDRRVSELE